jgi:hypothetical protein
MSQSDTFDGPIIRRFVKFASPSNCENSLAFVTKEVCELSRKQLMKSKKTLNKIFVECNRVIIIRSTVCFTDLVKFKLLVVVRFWAGEIFHYCPRYLKKWRQPQKCLGNLLKSDLEILSFS